tara:strand:- start:114 stop:404 length:291 start_codon:yes stop_codon:yes gene_type:complete
MVDSVIKNFTDASRIKYPQLNDWVLVERGSFQVKSLWVEADLEVSEKRWCDQEIANIQWIIEDASEHPEKTKYKTYEAALKAWPATSDFPSTRPTL